MGLLLVLFLTAFLLAAGNALPFNWITIGDWGGAALDAQDKQNVYDVANAMANSASQNKPAFVINTGDNFYWCGIQNSTDPQIKIDFEMPYSAPSLNSLNWFSVMGNHGK